MSIVGAHALTVLVRQDGLHCVQLQSCKPGNPTPDLLRTGPWEAPDEAARRIREVAESLAASIKDAFDIVLARRGPGGRN